MTINLQKPDITELKPKITVFGVGGGGGNAVNNMIRGGLQGVEFVVANTDAQALTMSAAEKVVQLGVDVTEGLGAGSHPEVGKAAAEECITEIQDYLTGTHMAFVTAGMGGGTGTGAAPVVARAAREAGILTVGVVTKPFQFEGNGRMKTAEEGILELQKHVDSLIVIPNQNLFRIANDKTTFADAFGMADQVLYSGVACITDLMVKEGLINLDFADVRSVMRDMGKAMMGTGEASGDGRAMQAAEAAISNPLLDESSMGGAKGLLISITGGRDLTLFEVDEAATRIREEVDQDANIILGATFDENLEGVIRVSVVATGIDKVGLQKPELPAMKSAVQNVTRANTAPAMGETKMEKPTVQAPPAAASIKRQETAAPVAEKPAVAGGVTKTAEGVTIAPYKPETSIFTNPEIEQEFKSALESEILPTSGEYVPPAAEEPKGIVETGHVPAIGELTPAPAPKTVGLDMQPSGSTPKGDGASDGSQNGAMGLLSKLKNSFAGRDEMQSNAAQPGSASPAPKAAAAPVAQRSVPQNGVRGVAGPGSDDNPYAPKRQPLDAQGRVNPATDAVGEDDQLEIPAFLRRQAN